MCKHRRRISEPRRKGYYCERVYWNKQKHPNEIMNQLNKQRLDQIAN